MPSFNIIKKCEYSDSFRVNSVKGQYDLQMNEIEERFTGKIDLKDKEWQIGLIYGSSGTGKTTIGKELFDENYITKYEYNEKSVIDDFNENNSIREITRALNNVGFSSPPSWLKPYNVLSEGEKMRVNLARAILSEKDLFVFDEFTSVVDRNVAKFGSMAINKSIKKTNKKFIAISCHSDIIEWLEPDWVFCTDNMEFKYTRGLLRRPKIEVKIYRKKGQWNIFRKYHYLDHGLNNSSHQYVGFIDDNPVCFLAVLHQPHNVVKNMKRISRIVVLPDYQGVGIGIKFMNKIGDNYKKNKFRFVIVTSHGVTIGSLKKNGKWVATSIGRKKKHQSLGVTGLFDSSKRRTVSFEYIGDGECN